MGNDYSRLSWGHNDIVTLQRLSYTRFSDSPLADGHLAGRLKQRWRASPTQDGAAGSECDVLVASLNNQRIVRIIPAQWDRGNMQGSLRVALRAQENQPETAPVVAVTGRGGVGKSSSALLVIYDELVNGGNVYFVRGVRELFKLSKITFSPQHGADDNGSATNVFSSRTSRAPRGKLSLGIERLVSPFQWLEDIQRNSKSGNGVIKDLILVDQPWRSFESIAWPIRARVLVTGLEMPTRGETQIPVQTANGKPVARLQLGTYSKQEIDAVRSLVRVDGKGGGNGTGDGKPDLAAIERDVESFMSFGLPNMPQYLNMVVDATATWYQELRKPVLPLESLPKFQSSKPVEAVFRDLLERLAARDGVAEVMFAQCLALEVFGMVPDCILQCHSLRDVNTRLAESKRCTEKQQHHQQRLHFQRIHSPACRAAATGKACSDSRGEAATA